jgi:hypothetical protein
MHYNLLHSQLKIQFTDQEMVIDGVTNRNYRKLLTTVLRLVVGDAEIQVSNQITGYEL